MVNGGDHSAPGTGTVANKFASLHNHPGNISQSSGDIYGFIDVVTNNSLFETNYVVTPDGTVYALIVTDLGAAKKFNTDYPRVPGVNGYEPTFPQNIVDEINEMKGWGGATDEMAIAFILEKYKAGVALLIQSANSDFKRLGTKENVDANGNKTYASNNCQ